MSFPADHTNSQITPVSDMTYLTNMTHLTGMTLSTNHKPKI